MVTHDTPCDADDRLCGDGACGGNALGRSNDPYEGSVLDGNNSPCEGNIHDGNNSPYEGSVLDEDYAEGDPHGLSEAEYSPSPDELYETAATVIRALDVYGVLPMEMLTHIVSANVTHNRTTRIRRAVRTMTETAVAQCVMTGAVGIGSLSGGTFVAGEFPNRKKTYGWSGPKTAVRMADASLKGRPAVDCGKRRRAVTKFGTVYIPPAVRVFAVLSGFGEEIDIPMLRREIGMSSSEMRTALAFLERREMVYQRMRGGVWAVRAYHVRERERHNLCAGLTAVSRA